jgi:hypothetical protein
MISGFPPGHFPRTPTLRGNSIKLVLHEGGLLPWPQHKDTEHNNTLPRWIITTLGIRNSLHNRQGKTAHYAQRHYAEFRVLLAVKLSVVMLSIVTPQPCTKTLG